MIPKRIITIWLSVQPMPELIQKCIDSQAEMCQKFGYKHMIVGLDNIEHAPKYVIECLQAEKYAKAVDYLRAWYLEKYGGIYLDADVEILPGRSFDDLLGNQIFSGHEENHFVSNAIIGSVKGHPLLKEYLETVETNFIGSGNLVFQPGMYLWTELMWKAVNECAYGKGVRIFPPDYFLPYDHHTGHLNITKNSRCVHHFSKSWVSK